VDRSDRDMRVLLRPSRTCRARHAARHRF